MAMGVPCRVVAGPCWFADPRLRGRIAALAGVASDFFTERQNRFAAPRGPSPAAPVANDSRRHARRDSGGWLGRERELAGPVDRSRGRPARPRWWKRGREARRPQQGEDANHSIGWGDPRESSRRRDREHTRPAREL